MHLQNLKLYYLHSLGSPSHKINVKTNARPIKFPGNWQKLTQNHHFVELSHNPEHMGLPQKTNIPDEDELTIKN